MSITTVFDASKPPASIPPGCKAVMGYIGRENFTPHVWTLAEWRQFREIPQLPIWVPDLAANPIAEATEAIKAVLAIGWAPYQVHQRAIIFDFETNIARTWWANCASQVSTAGFCPVLYGSLSTILENAASDLLVAAWDDSPTLLPGQTIHGHQWEADIDFEGTQIDYSVIDEWLLERAGVGPRHE